MSELAFNRAILEKNNQILAILTLASFSINILLAVVLTFAVNKPPLIVSKESDQLIGLQKEKFKLDEDGLKDFVHMIAKQYLNFNYNSIERQIDEISKYLGSQPLDSIKDSLEKNESMIKQGNFSQEFVVNDVRLIKKSSPYILELEGTRALWVNGHTKSAPVTYVLKVERSKPTQSNPYGLLVSEIKEKDVQARKKI